MNACTKIDYGTKRAASKALGRASKRTRGMKLYSYQCDICNGWHLTRIDRTTRAYRKRRQNSDQPDQ